MSAGDGEVAERLTRALAERAEGEVDALLDEAFAGAREEVAAVLRTAATRALLASALGRLERPEPAAASGDAGQPAEAAESSGTARVSQAAESEPPAEPALYAYGITTADTQVPGGTVSGVDGASLRAIDADGLRAVVSEVDPAEFDEESLADRLGDTDWVERKIRAHDEVLRALVAAGPLIPLRFGTIVASDEDVHGLLGRQRESFEATLARLRGAAEWGVKGRWGADALRAHALRTSDAARTVEAGTNPSGGGTAYLLGRRQERAVAEDEGRLRDEVLGECHRRLTDIARDGVLLPVRSAVREEEDLVMNGSYLVGDEDLARFRSTVADLSAEFAEAGLRLELTGPWPPYSFVAGESLDEDAT